MADDPATAMIPVVILSWLSHAESETPPGGVDKPFDERSLEEALVCRGESGARILLVEDDEGRAAKREVTHDGA